jgi:hypothetical protein
MRIPPTITKQQLIESQIGVALGMHEDGASQAVIANYNMTIIRGPRRAYKRSIIDHNSCRIARLVFKLRRISLQGLINRFDFDLSKKTVALQTPRGSETHCSQTTSLSSTHGFQTRVG